MKTKTLLLICIVLLFPGCKALDKLTQFDMNYNESFTVPSTTGISLPVDIITPEIATSSESEFSVNDTRKDLIEKINLKTMSLTLTSPADGNLSFLNSITIYLSAEGLSEIKLAWNNNIPENTGTVINLETTDSDLKEYIKKDKFSLRVNTVTDKLITSDHQIKADMVFFVDAKILGL